MSKKTKQEKKVSELRRKLNSLETASSQEDEAIVDLKRTTSETSVKSGINYTYSLKNTSSLTQNKTTVAQIADYSYVYHDLKRILSLTAIAILSQFILYFVINGQLVSLLSKIR